MKVEVWSRPPLFLEIAKTNNKFQLLKIYYETAKLHATVQQHGFRHEKCNKSILDLF